MRAWLGLALALTLTACSGNKDTETDATDATDVVETDDTGTTGGGESFGPIYQDLLKPSCALAGCHAAGSGNGMELTDDGAYAALVNQPARDAAGETYVIPGDADGSYIIKKMEGAPDIVGFPMPSPFGWADCCQEDIDRVRAWIDAGANP